jgi:hypothetical protein
MIARWSAARIAAREDAAAMENGRDNRHGAGRIGVHPRLGPLPLNDQVSISFNGGEVAAYAGESLIAALLAAGVRELRTMPRTGESRGGYCLVGRCSDCLVIVDGLPNVYACQTSVVAGMVVETQHGLGHWPGATS